MANLERNISNVDFSIPEIYEPLFTKEELDKINEIDREVENELGNCVNLLDYKKNGRRGILSGFFEKIQKTYRDFPENLLIYLYSK